MEVAFTLVTLLSIVVSVGAAARRFGLPAPLILAAVGAVGSFLPVVPAVPMSPELALVGLLPPLLYAAAIRTSLVDFQRNVRPIGLLSVGLVVFTAVGVGLVTLWVLPVPPAAAFALGAVVAPPDAVAATAIARRVGLPRQLVTILEGESLVNDATALVLLRTAVAGLGGTVGVLEVAGDFALAVGGGLLVGVLVALVVAAVRRRVDDPLTDTSISLVTPFVAYLAAEEVHASGVLALVVTGLLLGHLAPRVQSASSRIVERTNWATIQFVLENVVFLLIGLQAEQILQALGESTLSEARIVGAAAAVLVAVIALRPLWVFPATYLSRLVPGRAGTSPRPGPAEPTVISWAGMRGVVTLAAAFVLPATTPHREVLVLVALVVTGGTLLLQGATLPLLIRRLGLRGPDPGADALAEAETLQRASAAGRARLDEVVRPDDPAEVVERARRRGVDRANAVWERLGDEAETPSQAYARLRLEMVAAEREEVLRVRREGRVPHDVLQRVLLALDLEETTVEATAEEDRRCRGEDLRPAGLAGAACVHLQQARVPPPALTPAGCAQCLLTGQTWVHLRLCMACGHVGCCDSSVGTHAAAHHAATGHPVIRSFEPGEAWRWCYVDERLG